MASNLKLGSLLLDGAYIAPGSEYRPNQEISFGSGKDLRWVVVNGLLIADRPILVNISWDDLNQQRLVFGRPVTISGQKFLCRLLKVGTKKGAPNEWDSALDITGESNNLWHWKNIFCWGQETTDLDESDRAFRGYGSARRYCWGPSSDRDTDLGFRPVLEPVASDRLGSGNRVCAIGGQSVLHGKLLKTTAYDAVIKLGAGSKTSKSDIGKFYSKLQDGNITIDRTQMKVQLILGE